MLEQDMHFLRSYTATVYMYKVLIKIGSSV